MATPVTSASATPADKQEPIEQKKTSLLPERRDSIESSAGSCSCLPVWLQECFSSIAACFSACWKWVVGLFGPASLDPAIIADPMIHLEQEIADWKDLHGPIDTLATLFHAHEQTAPVRLAMVMTVAENGATNKIHAVKCFEGPFIAQIIKNTYKAQCPGFFKTVKEAYTRQKTGFDPKRHVGAIYLIGSMYHKSEKNWSVCGAVRTIGDESQPSCPCLFRLSHDKHLKLWTSETKGYKTWKLPFQEIEKFLFT